ncbi:MAG: hypothetical protein HXK63_04440 [Campylobacter sp.]|nr:hypothetical protein [Campylobacter sp.]
MRAIRVRHKFCNPCRRPPVAVLGKLRCFVGLTPGVLRTGVAIKFHFYYFHPHCTSSNFKILYPLNIGANPQDLGLRGLGRKISQTAAINLCGKILPRGILLKLLP